jgi:branched-chain amino acid transport system substrate-binding protein
MRYAKPDGSAGADTGADAGPERIVFPDLVQGTPEEITLAGESEQPDGTRYRLWHMRGEFKNDFDFHHFPLDRQTLTIRFLNAHADSSRIVYVRDHEEPGGIEAGPFRNLTQWDATAAGQQRYASRTRSSLGAPQAAGLEQGHELSGYNYSVELRRNVISAMTKTMLPLAVMTLIMYAALFFPHALVKETVTVVITVALSGTVLLSSINTQLGDAGYILAVEYVFYIFFALCLFSIVGVLTAERLRAAGHAPLDRAVIRVTRAVFALVIVVAIGAGWLVSARW